MTALPHHRRSIRLPDYEYSNAGAYFVTLCARNRECVFDEAVPANIVTEVWYALPDWFPTIALDEFVVMPNHVHLIVWLRARPADVGATLAVALADGDEGAGASPAPTTRSWDIPKPEVVNMKPTLGDVIGAYKSIVFAVYHDWVQVHDPQRRAKFWQRNYYEHVIRNERELNVIRQYIRDNPAQWALDRDNPENVRGLPLPTRIEDYLADLSGGTSA